MKKAFILFLVFGLLCSSCGIADSLLLFEKAADTYAYAEELMGTGEYKEAAQYFDSISAYRDASKQGMYCKACALCEEGSFEMGLNAFELLGDFKDSPFRLSYYTARSLEANAVGTTEFEQLETAKAWYEKNPLYLDSLERIAALEKRIATAKAMQPTPAPTPEPTPEPTPKPTPEVDKNLLSQAAVGDYIVFGAYEQDNNTQNGKEDIEWQVLAKDNDLLFVISRYALDCQPYNKNYTNVTWESCTLRTWLNQDFLNAAFKDAEKAMIPTALVNADPNPEYDTDPGNNTLDKIFLLSITEIKQYFMTDSAMKCTPTIYAQKQGAFASSDNLCWWWLRSPGYNQSDSAFVDTNKGIYTSGDSVRIKRNAVRPALWIYFGNGPLPEEQIKIEHATTKPNSANTSSKITPKPTANQSSCTECGGDGKIIVSCNKCGGDGKTESQCATCSGSGVRQCSGCYAVGYISCNLCDGDGHTLCWKCSGRGREEGRLCQQCGGTGFGRKCVQCNGKGILACYYCNGSKYVSCGTCNGRGNRSSTCSGCNGGGKVTKKCTKCQ